MQQQQQKQQLQQQNNKNNKYNINKQNIKLSIWKTAEEILTHWECCYLVATKRLKYETVLTGIIKNLFLC